MAATKGTNSYVSLAEAEIYFDDRMDVDAWDTANDVQKGKALVTAASLLDNMNWIGSVIDSSQSMAFPRSGHYFDPRLGTDTSLSSVIPSRITSANCELAYHLLNNDGLLDDTGSIQELAVASINLTNVRKPSKIPGIVMNLIRPLLVNAGSNSWWRAN